MEITSSQADIIYGPILSRRLGRSLGINLLGWGQKVCNYNCIYCECGSANPLEISRVTPVFPAVDDVLAVVARALKKPRTLDCITFSGNGEPTLHPDFCQIVQGVLTLRNKIRPGVKLAIFTNSSLVTHQEVFSSLQQFDLPMMKLDAGDENMFQAVNRPTKTICFSNLIFALREMPNLMIQSLLFDGQHSNAEGDRYEAWAQFLAALQPSAVHVYTVSRPPADLSVLAISNKKLMDIEDDLRKRFGLSVKAYY